MELGHLLTRSGLTYPEILFLKCTSMDFLIVVYFKFLFKYVELISFVLNPCAVILWNNFLFTTRQVSFEPSAFSCKTVESLFFSFVQPLKWNWQRNIHETPLLIPVRCASLVHYITLVIKESSLSFTENCKYGQNFFDEIKFRLYLYRMCVTSYLSGRSRDIIQQRMKAESRRRWKAPHIVLFGMGVC